MSREICVYMDELEPHHQDKIAAVAAAGGMTARFFRTGEEDAARACARGAEVLYSMSRKPLAWAENLKWYCSASAGVDDLSARPEMVPAGCVVTNSNVYGLTIAEHTVMVALMLLRQMPAYEARVREKRWQGGLPIRSIHGLEAVMVGTGQIGRCIADRFHALGAAKVTGVNRSGRSVEGFDEIVPVDRIDQVLPGAEMVILAVPGTDRTVRLLSRERIALLRRDALVINVGRGTAIDQTALTEALNDGRIAGAALDVAVPEPLPADDPLWTAKNLILTPHVSGNFTLAYTRDRNVESFCGDLENYIAGRPLAHRVDLARGY